MQTIEQVQAAWAALDTQGQMEAWSEFTRDLDYGQAGWNPFYLILMPMWEQGKAPTFDLASAFNDEDFEDSELEMDGFPMPAEMMGFENYIPW